MSHHTTSWHSHSSTWRWTAGKDGRSPEGEKARRPGGRPALARQKALREHDECEMPMQAIPAPPLVVVQATRALGILLALRDGPAAVGQRDQALQRGVRRQGAEVPLDLAAFARHRAFTEQPALRPRPDTMMAGRELRATGSPVCPYGGARFAQGPVVTLAPGNRLPAVLGEGIEHGLRRIERRGARLLRLAAPPRRRWGPEGCRVDLL